MQVNRNNLYDNNFKKIGNSKNNIRIVSNFLTKNICDELIKITNNTKLPNFKENDGFWDEMIYFNNDFSKILLPSVEQIKTIIEDTYDISIIKLHKINVIKWDAGKFLGPHIDDESEQTLTNHISSILYLNDNYLGGELYFNDHNLEIKPKSGDLIFFPGNKNYKHEVKKIIKGSRYTVPIWFMYN